MATELSNYDNDYRERYRGTTAPSITGWALHKLQTSLYLCLTKLYMVSMVTLT